MPAPRLTEASMRCSAAGHQRAFQPCSLPGAPGLNRRRPSERLCSSGAASRTGGRAIRATRPQQHRVARRAAATCQAAADKKLTVAITGASLVCVCVQQG